MKSIAYRLSSVHVFLILPFLLWGCGKPAEEPVVEAKPRAVQVQTISSRNLPVMVHAVGRLVPDRQVVISAQVPGILMQYDADVGSKVALGQMLAILDTVDYQLALDEARANLLAARVRHTAAQKAFNRARRLLPAKAITPEAFDKAEAAFKSAEASVSQMENMQGLAQRRLDKTSIKAPFKGHVTKRFVEIGQNVSVGDPVMNLADMAHMRVKIHINEMDYVHLDKDDPVKVTVEAYSGETVDGRLDKIGIQADARTNTFEVEILLDNADFGLKAGLTARVAIQSDVMSNVILVPQKSVLFRENRKEVFVIDADKTALSREVKLGRVNGSDVQITDGVQPGDTLVVTGGQWLKSGDKVMVAP